MEKTKNVLSQKQREKGTYSGNKQTKGTRDGSVLRTTAGLSPKIIGNSFNTTLSNATYFVVVLFVLFVSVVVVACCFKHDLCFTNIVDPMKQPNTQTTTTKTIHQTTTTKDYVNLVWFCGWFWKVSLPLSLSLSCFVRGNVSFTDYS